MEYTLRNDCPGSRAVGVLQIYSFFCRSISHPSLPENLLQRLEPLHYRLNYFLNDVLVAHEHGMSFSSTPLTKTSSIQHPTKCWCSEKSGNVFCSAVVTTQRSTTKSPGPHYFANKSIIHLTSFGGSKRSKCLTMAPESNALTASNLVKPRNVVHFIDPYWAAQMYSLRLVVRTFQHVSLLATTSPEM